MSDTQMFYRVPTPWLSPQAIEATQAAGGQGTPAAATWPANNRALYVPVSVPYSATLTALSFAATVTGSGNYDLGLYDRFFTRIASKGSTALAADVNTFTLTNPYRMPAGTLFYAAVVCSTTSAQVIRHTSGVVGQMVSAGYAQEALGSTVLPSSGTPAILSATFAPVVALHLR